MVVSILKNADNHFLNWVNNCIGYAKIKNSIPGEHWFACVLLCADGNNFNKSLKMRDIEKAK
jgi:hypothetical protein